MKRIRLDGTFIEAKVFATRCYGCGMPLLAADEYHPHEACVEFERSLSSDTVEPLLEKLWAGRA